MAQWAPGKCGIRIPRAATLLPLETPLVISRLPAGGWHGGLNLGDDYNPRHHHWCEGKGDDRVRNRCLDAWMSKDAGQGPCAVWLHVQTAGKSVGRALLKSPSTPHFMCEKDSPGKLHGAKTSFRTPFLAQGIRIVTLGSLRRDRKELGFIRGAQCLSAWGGLVGHLQRCDVLS